MPRRGGARQRAAQLDQQAEALRYTAATTHQTVQHHVQKQRALLADQPQIIQEARTTAEQRLDGQVGLGLAQLLALVDADRAFQAQQQRPRLLGQILAADAEFFPARHMAHHIVVGKRPARPAARRTAEELFDLPPEMRGREGAGPTPRPDRCRSSLPGSAATPPPAWPDPRGRRRIFPSATHGAPHRGWKTPSTASRPAHRRRTLRPAPGNARPRTRPASRRNRPYAAARRWCTGPIIRMAWCDLPTSPTIARASNSSSSLRIRSRKARFSGWFLETRWYCML